MWFPELMNPDVHEAFFLKIEARPRHSFEGQNQDVQVRDRGISNWSRGDAENKAFRARDRDEAETFSREAETKMSIPRHWKFKPRQGTTAPRDWLETEASRLRPHPH